MGPMISGRRTYGGWAAAIDQHLDHTGTCHYQQIDLGIVSFACGIQDGGRPIYAGGTWPTRESCEEATGTHACQRCVRIEATHPAEGV